MIPMNWRAELVITHAQRLSEPSSEIRQMLNSDPFTQPHAARLEQELTDYISAERRNAPMVEQIQSITAQLTLLDAASDQQMSGLARTLQGIIQLTQDDSTRQGLQEALSALQHVGISSMIRSRYDAVSGFATTLNKALSPSARQALSAVTFDNATLEQMLDAWIERAHRISALEQQRSELLANNTTPPPIHTADIQRLLRDVIRRINRIITSLPDSSISTEDQRRILAPIQQSLSR